MTDYSFIYPVKSNGPPVMKVDRFFLVKTIRLGNDSSEQTYNNK